MLKRLPVLISFAEGADYVLETLRPDWDVLLDSGAFSNFTAGRDVVTIDGYRSFLEMHGASFWHYMNLDRIGDAAASRDNLAYLRACNLRPVPVFQRGASFTELAEQGKQSDLVALGGIAGSILRSHRLEYLRAACKAAARLQIPVHLLGIGGQAILSELRPYSADSSDYASSVRYGFVKLWDSKLRKFVDVWSSQSRTPNARALDRSRVQLLASYGEKLSDVMKHEYWTARRLNWGARFLAVRSYIRFAEHLAKLGVKYFISVTGSDVAFLASAWDRYKAADRAEIAPQL